MNKNVLKAAERAFLKRYPGGFEHPEMVALGKRHKMEQLVEFARQSFAKSRFDNAEQTVADMVALVGRSTLVSMFEKPKFKGLATALPRRGKERLARALLELLHGKEKTGFDALIEQLRQDKIAKWTLATVFQSYYRPQRDVFVKPTTAKLIISSLELDLNYQAVPTWAFYRDFRKVIKAIKAEVDPSLAPNNAAFCGFLMVSLDSPLRPRASK